MKIKKILASILIIFILFINIIPVTHAAIYKSTLEDYSYEPQSDDNLRNYTPQIIDKMDYLNWFTGNSRTFIDGTPSANLNGFYTLARPRQPRKDNYYNVTTISPFYLIVDNFWHNPDFVFGIPVLKRGNDYKYMYITVGLDKDSNSCLYIHYENKESEKEKLEWTCAGYFSEKKPYIIFFNLIISGNLENDKPRSYTWNTMKDGFGKIEIQYSVSYEKSIDQKQVIGVSRVKTLNFPFENILGSINNYEYQLIEGSSRNIKLGEKNVTINAVANQIPFKQLKSQKFLRPYSYNWKNIISEQFFHNSALTYGHYEKFSFKEIENLPNEGYNAVYSNMYYLAHGVNEQDYLDYYIPTILKSIYGPPLHKPDGINVDPDLNKPEEVGGIVKFETKKPIPPQCELTLTSVGCWFEWIGYFFNSFFYILQSIFNVIADFLNLTLKEIRNAYKISEEFFKDSFNIVQNLFKGGNDPTVQNASATQKLLCSKDFILQNKENIEQNEGIFGVVFNTLKAGFGIFGIIDPIAPTNGSKICTYEGIKTLKLRENSFVDIILFLIFGLSLFLLFYRKS